MNSVLFGVSYIGKAKNIFHGRFADSQRRSSQVSARQAPGSRQAFTDAMLHARSWGERYRRGAFGIVVASSDQSDSLIESMAPDFCQVPFGDLSAVDAAVDSLTVAIVLQTPPGGALGESDQDAYIQGVEKLCRDLNILLIRNDV